MRLRTLLLLALALLLAGCEGFEDTPPALPGGQPGVGLTTYDDPNGRWSIGYDAELLKPETLGEMVIFISEDRGTFIAVDSYVAEGNEFGNTGENLRNRARDSLDSIYDGNYEQGEPFVPALPWDTAMTFTTPGGSQGEAVYMQPGRDNGDFAVYGVLYGTRDGRQTRALQTMRNSFTVK